MTVALSQINFRDIGGLPTIDGKTVKSGIFYRSEGPGSFLDDHRVELRALGVRTICDLRSKDERAAAPHDWCGPDCNVLNLDMNTDLRAQGEDAWASLRADPSPANLYHAINGNYRAMPKALLPHIHAISDALVEGETPLVLHCTAGKDRTGVAVALYLSLLNVREEDILTDYAKSEAFMNNPRMLASVEQTFSHGLGIAPSREMMQYMIGIDKTHLLAALSAVSEQWGGIAGYFSAANVEFDDQNRLRAALLT